MSLLEKIAYKIHLRDSVIVVHAAPNPQVLKHTSKSMTMALIGGIVLVVDSIVFAGLVVTGVGLILLIALALNSYTLFKIVYLGEATSQSHAIIEVLELFVSLLVGFGAYTILRLIEVPKVNIYASVLAGFLGGLMFFKTTSSLAKTSPVFHSLILSPVLLSVTLAAFLAFDNPVILSMGVYGTGLGAVVYYFLHLHPWAVLSSEPEYSTLGVRYREGKELIKHYRVQRVIKELLSLNNKGGLQIAALAMETHKAVICSKNNVITIHHYNHKYVCPPKLPDVAITKEHTQFLVFIKRTYPRPSLEQTITITLKPGDTLKEASKILWGHLIKMLQLPPTTPAYLLDPNKLTEMIDYQLEISTGVGSKTKERWIFKVASGEVIEITALDKLSKLLIGYYVIPLKILQR